MDTVERYLRGVEAGYRKVGLGQTWDEFMAVSRGASADDLAALRRIYPQVPQSLLELLARVDGTFMTTDHDGHRHCLYFLGSDVDGGAYPYYLLSAQEIVANRGLATKYYGDYVNRMYGPDEVEIDERITTSTQGMTWLHFSDCMNNGGTSQLFIDFHPAPCGAVGQVVRFLHDPDNIAVIADSFEDYLDRQLDLDFAWLDATATE